MDEVTGESTITNNCSAPVTLTVGAAPAPDLIVSTFTVDNSSPVTGQYFTLNATVNNQGNGSSSSTTLRYYRSTDATITSSDAIISTAGIPGYLSVDGLSPSGSEAKTARTPAPYTLGTYYYGACVETVTGESDTTNNCSEAVTVTVQRTNQSPQLTGDVDDKVVTLGESFNVDLSGLFTDPDGDEITSYGFTYRTSGILTGVVNTKTGILSLRAIAVGETIVAVDARDSNGQSGNSEDLFKVTVVAAEAADKPGAPTGLSATADGQTEIDLSWTAPSDDGGADITGYRIEVSTDGSSWSDLVANTNATGTSYSHTGLTAGSTRHYRVSAINSAWDGLDIKHGLRYHGLVVERPANTNSTSTSYSHTGLTTGSTQHYRVSAINSAGTGPASNTDSATTDAATAPDLVVDALTASDSRPTAGASFTLSTTVRNQGNGSSTLTTLRYYRSTDSTITTSDMEVGTDQVSALSASGSGAESISLTAPSTAGTYYYGACVDSVTEESDTTNNCSTAATVTVAAAPDPTPTPVGKAVTGTISSCTGRQLSPGIDSYQWTVTGSVTAKRAVLNVTVTGKFNGGVIGADSIGDMEAGDSESFSITGYSSQGVGSCGVEIEWLEYS